jgi:endo-1,4-beta-xylanase
MKRKLLTAAMCATTAALAVTVAGPASAASGLAAAAEAGGRYFGTALTDGNLSNSTLIGVVNANFDMATPGNEMKWETSEPNQNQFNFGPGDAIVNFAKARGMRVRGHNLVWHSQLAGWVTGLPTNQVQAAMENHITTEVTHYKGQLYAWDVVNEPFNEDGTLRSDVFTQAMGNGYIADALRTARAADPSAKLYLNDFNIEGSGAKANGMFNLAQSLLQQGVPLDGIGFESHFIEGQNPSGIQANMQRFANLGLDVAVTELDDRIQLPDSTQKMAQQATDFSNTVKACVAVTRCVGVTPWGIGDADSWIPGFFSGFGDATMFDMNYQPKPDYNATLTALGGGGTDTTPPSQPGTPTASNVTSNSASLAWTASTDTGGSGLAGYNIYRRQGTTDTLLSQSTTNSATLTGLTASTQFVIVIRARDGAGNLSATSGTVTFTTQAGGGGTGPCRVGYSASNWGAGSNGFTANITLTNTGTAAINGWTLAFSFPSGQQLTPPGWSATWAQNGANLTATNLDWNRTLAAGTGSTTFGFNGTFTGTNTAPTSFTLNGTACTIG